MIIKPKLSNDFICDRKENHKVVKFSIQIEKEIGKRENQKLQEENKKLDNLPIPYYNMGREIKQEKF